MSERYLNIETVFVGYGRHYIQEDNPEAIGRNIADWYRWEIRHSHSQPHNTGERK